MTTRARPSRENTVLPGIHDDEHPVSNTPPLSQLASLSFVPGVFGAREAARRDRLKLS